VCLAVHQLAFGTLRELGIVASAEVALHAHILREDTADAILNVEPAEGLVATRVGTPAQAGGERRPYTTVADVLDPLCTTEALKGSELARDRLDATAPRLSVWCGDQNRWICHVPTSFEVEDPGSLG
jgi:hypothetical protein